MTAPASLCYACYERPAIDLCARCYRPSGSPFHWPKYYSNAHKYELPTGAGEYGNPVLVAVALTAEAAEAWRDEPAEGVRREVGPIPLLDGARLAAGLRRVAMPPTRIEDRP